MAAGSAAHLLETATLGHLLDRVMVEQQAFSHVHSIRSGFHSICEKKQLYKGFRWNVLSSSMKGAGGWSVHNFCNRNMSTFFPQKNPSEPSFGFTALVACSTAFMETTLFLCPLERLKILEMTYNSSQQMNLSLMIKEGGIKFLYRGWSLMIFQKSWSWVNYLGVYQQLRKRALQSNNYEPLNMYQKMALGSTTGALVACFNTPMDLLKARIQKHNSEQVKGIRFLAMSIFKTHGLRGMFRGLSLRIIRTSWATSVTVLVLDRFNALPQNMKV